MKIIEKTFFTLAIVFLVLVVILVPLKILLFNEDYYHFQFEKNSVYSKVANADAVLDNLLTFFKGEVELDYFTDNEKSHLEDVSVLLNRFFFVLWFSVIMVFVSLTTLFFLNKKDFKENVYKVLFLGGLSSFALLILLFLASINFSLTFGGFHQIFFPQGNFSFPETSLLITLFPQAFFRSYMLRMLITSLSLSVVCMAPQLILNRLNK
ncbi:MAG: DUF1461 domain-containing protein [archaeon]